MYSMTRLFIGVAIYLIYIFGIIAVLMVTGNPLLFVLLLFAGVGVFILAMMTGWLTTPGNYRRIMQQGEDADATILAMKDTGVTINNSPYVDLRLRVQPAGKPAYETNIKVALSRLAIPSVGDTLRVKFDPDKPQDVIVP